MAHGNISTSMTLKRTALKWRTVSETESINIMFIAVNKWVIIATSNIENGIAHRLMKTYNLSKINNVPRITILKKG